MYKKIIAFFHQINLQHLLYVQFVLLHLQILSLIAALKELFVL